MHGHRGVFAGLLAAVVLATACGATAPTDAEIGIGLATVPEVTTTTTSTTVVPETSTAAPETSTTTTLAPDPYRTWVATADDGVPHLIVHDAPEGNPISLPFLVPNPHQFGGPLTLMVTEGEPGDEWVKVQIPLRPNGREGWIETDGYTLTATRVHAEVDLTRSSVTVWDGEEVIAESDAVIGAEESPTPLGTFYVAAKRRNPESEPWLGPWALVLSSYSEAFETFSGGLPVIAIHGTDRPDETGAALTNGCVRVPNDVIEFLAEHVPLGAPVTVLS